eukprot:gene7354-biopygen11420
MEPACPPFPPPAAARASTGTRDAAAPLERPRAGSPAGERPRGGSPAGERPRGGSPALRQGGPARTGCQLAQQVRAALKPLRLRSVHPKVAEEVERSGRLPEKTPDGVMRALQELTETAVS